MKELKVSFLDVGIGGTIVLAKEDVEKVFSGEIYWFTDGIQKFRGYISSDHRFAIPDWLGDTNGLEI